MLAAATAPLPPRLTARPLAPLVMHAPLLVMLHVFMMHVLLLMLGSDVLLSDRGTEPPPPPMGAAATAIALRNDVESDGVAGAEGTEDSPPPAAEVTRGCHERGAVFEFMSSSSSPHPPPPRTFPPRPAMDSASPFRPSFGIVGDRRFASFSRRFRSLVASASARPPSAKLGFSKSKSSSDESCLASRAPPLVSKSPCRL